jgi:hypothetical protein
MSEEINNVNFILTKPNFLYLTGYYFCKNTFRRVAHFVNIYASKINFSNSRIDKYHYVWEA